MSDRINMNSVEQRLESIFKQLPPADQQTVLAFAEFLHSRVEKTLVVKPLERQFIPRPAKESVIAAIKRLSHTYPMLEKSKMLDKTAALMSEHVLQGRSAKSVIDQLEILFLQHYQEMMSHSAENTPTHTAVTEQLMEGEKV